MMMKFDLRIAVGALVLLVLVSIVSAQEDTDFEPQKEASVYIIGASADGYQHASIPVDATKGDSVEIQLSKTGSPASNPSPSPILIPKDPTTPGQTAPNLPSFSGNSISSTPQNLDSAKPLYEEIQVDRKMILISALEKQNTPVNEKIVVSNLGNIKASLNIQIAGISSISSSPSKLVVEPNKQGVISINGEISGLKVGTYPAKMTIKSDDGRISKEVAITVVVNPVSKLFDLLLDLVAPEKKAVFSGDDIPIKLKIINIAGTKFQIKLKYGIKDISRTFFSTEEDVISENPTSNLERNIKTSPDIPSGSYIIEAQLIKDGDINAVAAVNVYINSKKPAGGAGPITALLITAVIFCGAIGSALYMKRREIKSILGKPNKK